MDCVAWMDEFEFEFWDRDREYYYFDDDTYWAQDFDCFDDYSD